MTKVVDLERVLDQIEALAQIPPQRAEAEDQLLKVIDRLTGGELRQAEQRIRTAIESFRPSTMSRKKRCVRMRRLEDRLERALATIVEREEIDSIITGLISDVQRLLAAAELWVEEDLDAAGRRVGQLLRTCSELKRKFPVADATIAQASSIVRDKCFTVLDALLMSRATTLQDEVSSLKNADLNQVCLVVEQFTAQADQLASVNPAFEPIRNSAITSVERAIVRRLLRDCVPPALAWNSQVAGLIEKHCECALESPNFEDSVVLSVAVLLFDRVAEMVRHRCTTGIVGLTSAIRDYANSPLNTEGRTDFDSLTLEDLLIAADQSGNKFILDLIESHRIPSVAKLGAC